MALSVARLLPGRGLDLSYMDDRALDGSPMRGADNVRLVDGEWWTREGTKALRGVAGGGTPVHFVSIDVSRSTRRHFLIGQQACLEIDVEGSTYACSVPYSPSWTGTVNFTNNSATVSNVTTVTGNADHVNLLYGFDSDGVQCVYSVSSYSAGSSTFVLADKYRGATAATVSVSGFASPSRNQYQTGLTNFGTTYPVSWCVFRQRTTYTEGAVWGGGAATAPLYKDASPALAAGGMYLVWSHGRYPGSGVYNGATGPNLIRLDATETIKCDAMRRTQSSMTAAVAFATSDEPTAVATHRDRLIVVRGDENAKNDNRTIWYSEPGDLMRWHTGTAGGSPPATNNLLRLTEGNDPIQGLLPLGPSLIVHRTQSQVSLTPTGSSSFPPGPYTIEYNEQGVGCVSPSTLLSVRGAHIFWSQYGPAQFDGQRCTPLDPALSRVGAQLRGTAEWANGTYPLLTGLHAVYHAARQELWFRFSPGAVSDPWEGALANRSRFLVYSLNSGASTIASITDALCVGVFRRKVDGAEFVVAALTDSSRAPIVQVTQTGKVYDTPAAGAGTIFDETRSKYPAYVETKWFNFGTETEKEITKLEIEFRALSTSSSYQNEVGDDMDTSAFKYMLEIHTDLDMSKFAVQQVLTVTPSDLTGLSSYAEGRRMLPRVVVVPKVRVQGNLFKFRIKNFGTGISISQPFRIAQVQVFYEDREATRREKRP